MKLFSLQIIGAEGPLLQEKVEQVECPAQGGEIGILAEHAPTVAILDAGKITMHMKGGKKKQLEVQGGFMRVDNEGCSVMVQEGVENLKEQIKALA